MSVARQSRGILGLGRGVSIGLFLVGFLLTCASAASAFWTIPVVDGPNNIAIAEAGTLAAPTDPMATANGSNSITVAWTSPTGQLPGARYRVTRTMGPGSEFDVCTDASTSCQDTGLVAGSEYEYSIRAVLGAHWESPAAVASATTLGVTTTTLPSGSVGATYTTSLSAVGGNGSYTWALTSGTLPAGVTLNAATGAITGTPIAVGTASGLEFRVTSQGHTSTSGPLTLTVAQGSTSTTVTPSVTTVTYGAESAAAFAVMVRTANNALVTSGSVTVSVGSASCTVTLPASSCSMGNTALPAGGPYAVSATFIGDTNLASSTSSTSSGVTVEPDSATVSEFTVSSPSVIYGAEASLVFTASVATGQASLPGGAAVVVTQGSTTLCTITLTLGVGTCSPASGTVLPVGEYTVAATFNALGSYPNFEPATSTTTLDVTPDTATVDTFTVSGSPVIYGEETSLVFSANVSAANASIPNGATVVVTHDSTELCTITLTSGVGTCSPASGTVLPVGPYGVTATFNAGGSDPNFTTPTRTTSLTIIPNALAGIEWASVSTTGTFTCDYTNPLAVTCAATGVGNRGTFQAKVQLVNANRTPFNNPTAGDITVTQATTGGGGTTASAGSMTIASNDSTTPGTYTLTLKPGNQPTTTITASIAVNGVPYTVSCAVTR